MEYPAALQRLVLELRRLPGVGKRSAERFAFHLVNAPESEIGALVEALQEVRSKVRRCSECSTIDEQDPCRICRDERRDRALLCVVEDFRDVFAIESTHEYRGLYHILGGAISPLDGVGPEDLRIKPLPGRVTKLGVREVILATSSSVEGDATALYIAEMLKALPVKVTRIAFGLPVGSGLTFADQGSVIRALQGRHTLK